MKRFVRYLGAKDSRGYDLYEFVGVFYFLYPVFWVLGMGFAFGSFLRYLELFSACIRCL
jgi:hypothetical protein